MKAEICKVDRDENNESPRQQGNADVGRSGICFPYNDFYVMSSQILTIMATIFLWVDTTTLLMSVSAMVAHQIVVWCYHMHILSIETLPIVSMLASLSFFSHGMIRLGTLILNGLDQEEVTEEGFRLAVDQMIVAFFALMGGLFWMGSYLCMGSFVERGKNAQWQALVVAASASDSAKDESGRIERRTSEISEFKDELPRWDHNSYRTPTRGNCSATVSTFSS